jgi:hypothetical protein
MNYATEPKEEFHKCQLTVFVQGDLENVCPLGELKHELVCGLLSLINYIKLILKYMQEQD